MTESSTTRIAIDIGLVVVDMERSLAFYRDQLGLPVVAEITTSLIGQGRMVQLQHGASLIKLVQMDEVPSTQSPAGVAAAFGYRYITLMVADIPKMMAQATQGNTPIIQPLTTLGNGATIAMIADPDGNIVEFVQEAS